MPNIIPFQLWRLARSFMIESKIFNSQQLQFALVCLAIRQVTSAPPPPLRPLQSALLYRVGNSILGTGDI